MSDEESGSTEQTGAAAGKWMIIGLWVLLIAGGTFFAQKWMDKRSRGQIPASIAMPEGKKGVLLEADRLGHYVVQGDVNGQTVTFLVDTGASGVSIPGKIAEELELTPGARFPVTTANGTIMVYSTTLESLSIGELTRENVRASINSSMDGEVGLLGMTFLRHFELVQQDGFLAIREP